MINGGGQSRRTAQLSHDQNVTMRHNIMETTTISTKKMRRSQQREAARMAVAVAAKEDSWKQFAIPFGRICVVM